MLSDLMHCKVHSAECSLPKHLTNPVEVCSGLYRWSLTLRPFLLLESKAYHLNESSLLLRPRAERITSCIVDHRLPLRLAMRLHAYEGSA